MNRDAGLLIRSSTGHTWTLRPMGVLYAVGVGGHLPDVRPDPTLQPVEGRVKAPVPDREHHQGCCKPSRDAGEGTPDRRDEVDLPRMVRRNGHDNGHDQSVPY